MSDVKLKFIVTLKNGTKLDQEITVPADGDGQSVPTVEQFIIQMLQQYATVGMLKRDREKRKFIMVFASEISTAEVEEPSVLIPTTGELADAVRNEQQTKSGIVL